MTKTPYADLEFNANGTPFSKQFDDIYFSNSDGLAETRYVFIDKNGLPSRIAEFENHTLVVGETGFGTGLNFLAMWQSFDSYCKAEQINNVKLHFYSFEKYPIAKQELVNALNNFQELEEYNQRLLASYPEIINNKIELSFNNGAILLSVFIGDVNQQIQQLKSGDIKPVNAWFLDGFAPSKNPDMWQQNLFNNMARLSAPFATLATFTAAGFVRRGLIEAGFEMKKHPGFGHKREMISGVLNSNND